MCSLKLLVLFDSAIIFRPNNHCSLEHEKVIIFVSLLALPVIHVIYSILNRGLGNTTINFILWSQTFVVLSAVSIAWTSRDITTLRRMTRPNGTTTTAIFNDDDDDDNTGGSIAYGRESPRETSAVEICIIQIAESMLSREDGPGQGEDQGLYLSVVRTAREAESHGLPIDTPVLQSAPALKAWRQVIQHQRDVEGHIRETHRWGALGEKLISMNAGMPFMVGIVQVFTIKSGHRFCLESCVLIPLPGCHNYTCRKEIKERGEPPSSWSTRLHVAFWTSYPCIFITRTFGIVTHTKNTASILGL